MVCFCSIPYIFGMIIIIKYIFKLLNFIFKHFLLPSNDLKSKYGDGYALVTGGSGGISLSFAKELLKMKFKLCLLSSNKITWKKQKKNY